MLSYGDNSYGDGLIGFTILDVRRCVMSVPFDQPEVCGGWVYNPILVIGFTKPINYSR